MEIGKERWRDVLHTNTDISILNGKSKRIFFIVIISIHFFYLIFHLLFFYLKNVGLKPVQKLPTNESFKTENI